VSSPPVLTTEAELKEALAPLWEAQRPLVFVPTMGDLHRGHLSLVELGARLGPVLVSIFVNPTQFGPNEDYDAYPRDLRHDLDLLEQIDGVEAVFAPDAATMYPPDDTTFVEVTGVGEPLEGEFRPGHLRGVTTIVAKLFLLVRPGVAVFGQKDAQQCLVVRRMVEDLRFPLRLVFGPTVREEDGLAMSSRNRYLDGEQRKRATVLVRALRRGREALEQGERRADVVEALMLDQLRREGAEVDYAAVRRVDDLSPLERVEGRVLLAIAARVGSARLIDNFCLQVDEGGVREAPLRDDNTFEAVASALR